MVTPTPPSVMMPPASTDGGFLHSPLHKPTETLYVSVMALAQRKTNTYVGLDPEELAIVREVQQSMRCTASAAIRLLIRTAHTSQLSFPILTAEKENKSS